MNHIVSGSIFDIEIELDIEYYYVELPAKNFCGKELCIEHVKIGEIDILPGLPKPIIENIKKEIEEGD